MLITEFWLFLLEGHQEPRRGQAPSGVWTGNFPILITTPQPTLPLSLDT